jgi:hypothetical protein
MRGVSQAYRTRPSPPERYKCTDLSSKFDYPAPQSIKCPVSRLHVGRSQQGTWIDRQFVPESMAEEVKGKLGYIYCVQTPLHRAVVPH